MKSPYVQLDSAGSLSIECGSIDNDVALLGLRVGSVFIIWACSSAGALFPILSKRSKYLSVPTMAYDFAKYFGSGVIIATAFIHLLAPAIDKLISPCLGVAWTEYPWALAVSMGSVFGIFFLELTAFRWGSSKLASTGLQVHNPHGNDLGNSGAPAAHGPELPHSLTHSQELPAKQKDLPVDIVTPTLDSQELGVSRERGVLDTATAQVLDLAILEFGVLFHSVLIGLTLAVDEDFKVLFVVLVFHQTFEGLGLGTRLAS
ncbi:hypothetical protein M422DRAFT_257561 [Sphaerobolus stellatus SS14]|uniref:Zinc/iron permease n=1 Tax=Sphaerobolus stellatus (strain SS14) TaxID=990650 RepID=A0A0C9U9I0_SPHS4|nr:hypothetical protein M422DRAFT_257561 [Sphaerobolus stellatus SS14]